VAGSQRDLDDSRRSRQGLDHRLQNQPELGHDGRLLVVQLRWASALVARLGQPRAGYFHDYPKVAVMSVIEILFDYMFGCSAGQLRGGLPGRGGPGGRGRKECPGLGGAGAGRSRGQWPERARANGGSGDRGQWRERDRGPGQWRERSQGQWRRPGTGRGAGQGQ